MRIRNVKNAQSIVDNHPLVIEEVNKQTFANPNPIHIEIGMGKGEFIIQMSKTYPDINFIGIEKYASVLVRALKKNPELPNLRFMCLDAKDINEVFKVIIKAIYLNFSDPWQKKKHIKRRLTSDDFLAKYALLFDDEINIYQKTDNDDFFAYSMANLQKNGYKIIESVVDLANSGIPNIPTEYEKKFMLQGKNINFLHATKKIRECKQKSAIICK